MYTQEFDEYSFPLVFPVSPCYKDCNRWAFIRAFLYAHLTPMYFLLFTSICASPVYSAKVPLLAWYGIKGLVILSSSHNPLTPILSKSLPDSNWYNLDFSSNPWLNLLQIPLLCKKSSFCSLKEYAGITLCILSMVDSLRSRVEAIKESYFYWKIAFWIFGQLLVSQKDLFLW